MNRFIANSTAAYPLGVPTGTKLFYVPTGSYTRRVAFLYASTASNISITWADPPYGDFSTPADILTDAADMPFDAYMDGAGNIYIAYTISGTNDLGFCKLTFDGATWTAGSPVIVYNGDDNYYPSIAKRSDGVIWIAWSRFSSNNHYVSAKSSANEGVNWGTVSSPQHTLTGAASSAYPRIVEAGGDFYVFYSEGSTQIAYRKYNTPADPWFTEVVLASGGGYDQNLSAVASTDGRIALCYKASDGLRFREYAGSSWSVEILIDSSTISQPNSVYRGGALYLLYHVELGNSMFLPYYSKRANNVFSTPTTLSNNRDYFDKLLLFNDATGTYEDMTTEASSSASADIKHSSSAALLSAINDTLYMGEDHPVNLIRFILSSTGSGGTVVWKYWDGQSWKSFTPASGAWHFSSAEHDLLLWDDVNSVPSDWQKLELSGSSKYWISATVSAGFTGEPVGSRIAAIANSIAMKAQV